MENSGIFFFAKEISPDGEFVFFSQRTYREGILMENLGCVSRKYFVKTYDRVLHESFVWGTCWNKYHLHFMSDYDFWLVGGLNPSEKILVNWDDYSQYMGK